MSAAARPQVSVQTIKDSDSATQLSIPSVLLAPVRPDVVHFVHSNMAKNSRQAYAVNIDAGHQHSAHSWGTGRAVARIPRVSGSGTSAAAQGAFGNMCRHGRMFAPTKTWRKWHRKINTNQKRYAVVSALSASALPALVMARGHRVDDVAEVPLVVPSHVEGIQRTKEAISVLKAVGAFADVEKARNSKKLRAGKGKMRDRRYTMRRGPLVVYNEDNGIVQAFRNLPGVELCQVERLNLLQLAPGGHMGRFIIWTEAAFGRLDEIWGTQRRVSSHKKNYTLPRNIMTNSDITRIINSDEVQSKVRTAISKVNRSTRKRNPLKNRGAMDKLNPYAQHVRKLAVLSEKRRAKQKDEAKAKRRAAQGKPHKRAQKNAAYRRINAD